ncbi:MAG TPA: zinc-dependent metalloprotease family protein [Pyrinomonadaceae bacterium]
MPRPPLLASLKRFPIFLLMLACLGSGLLLASVGQSITSTQAEGSRGQFKLQSELSDDSSLLPPLKLAGGIQDSSLSYDEYRTQESRLKADIEKSIRRYELVKLDAVELAARVRNTGELSLKTPNRNLDIELTPHDLRAPNYRAEEVGTDGQLHPVKSGPIHTFKGTVRGMEGALARFTVDEKRVEGLILTRSAQYFIEPARKYSSAAGSSDYLLYDSSDAIESSVSGCGVTLSEAVESQVESIQSRVDPSMSSQQPTDSAAIASTLRVVQLATEADYEHVTKSGGSTQANDEILSIMNQVDGIYNTDLGIGFTIVYQHTWATANDPYTATSASGTLSEFRSYWNDNKGTVARDLAHLFTARSMNDYAGYAWIGVVCALPGQSYAVSLVRAWRPVTIVAHEIGHNFGGTHVDNTSSCEISIMESGAGWATTFCEFSRTQINNFIAHNPSCLSISPTSCAYTLSSSGETFGTDAGAGAVTITAPGGCNWLATSNQEWISIVGAGTPGSPNYFSGNGSATLDYTIAANSGYKRKGTISIAGQTFTVTQGGTLSDCMVTPLQMGQTRNGTLSTSDCASIWRFYFTYADTYSFSGSAGQQIRLSMNAPGFVPYIYLTAPDGALVSASNNNGGPNNAFIPHSDSLLTLPVTGLYSVEATSWGNAPTGAYSLTLAAAPTVVTRAASSVSTSGAQLNGSVNPNGSASKTWFEWGTSSTLASFSSTPQQSVGLTNVEVSASLSGLASETTYYYRVASSNITGNTTNVTKGSIFKFVTTLSKIQVIVQTNPAGRSFTVDQTTFTSTQTFMWAAGSSHMISATSLQSGTTGTRYVWNGWSDSGAMSHTVSPVSNTTFTANFGTQYFLTMNAGAGGSVSASSGWYNSGQLVQISATPNSGFDFSGWAGSGNGSYSGPNNPASVTMNAPVTQTASFSPIQVQVTVQTNPAGRSFIVDQTTYTSTQTFMWAAGSSHMISVTSPQSGTTGTRYIWNGWSDSGAMSHTVSPVSNTTFTANFGTQYFLTMNAGSGGSVSASGGWYNSGQLVQISATPNNGFNFSGWAGSGNGSYSGPNNPASVTMNAPVTQTASFSQIQAPTATTNAASAVTVSSATLNGNVHPNNSSTSGWFEWGTSANLSSFNSTSSQSIGSGSVGLSLSANLTGLAGDTTYYFRVAAANGGGTTKGAIQTFKTVLPVILLTEENSNRAIALDSVTMLRDPFSIAADHNFGLDRRTRIIIFALNVKLLPGESTSAVTAQAEDSQQRIIPLVVEYIGGVSNFDSLTQINLRLPDELANAGDVWVSISLRDTASNKVLVSIGPSP